MPSTSGCKILIYPAVSRWQLQRAGRLDPEKYSVASSRVRPLSLISLSGLSTWGGDGALGSN